MAQVDQIVAQLRELEGKKFYGTLEITLQAGRVILVRETRTYKLEEDQRNSRGSYDLQDCKST